MTGEHPSDWPALLHVLSQDNSFLLERHLLYIGLQDALCPRGRWRANEIASDIRHLSRARWEKTIEELSPETGTLWRRTSLLKKPFHPHPPKWRSRQYRSCPD
ncbi:hypothetical protein TNCV_830991 [Trichonephila clavipes]|nr:hypothetical protein TNCV_830991 [Trichonephila clavipes]